MPVYDICSERQSNLPEEVPYVTKAGLETGSSWFRKLSFLFFPSFLSFLIVYFYFMCIGVLPACVSV